MDCMHMDGLPMRGEIMSLLNTSMDDVFVLVPGQ